MQPSPVGMNNSLENTEYTIERLNKNNLKDLEKLYAAVYGKPASNNFFFKKYDTAYTGARYIGFIAYNNDGTPVAYYGVIPCFIQYGNNVILSAQSADTMTHPKHRYKGLFVKLSTCTFALCRIENIHILFGFPNQNFFNSAVHKLKWIITETMDCFIIPVSTIPLEKLSTKFSFLKMQYENYKRWVLKRFLTTQTGVANSVFMDGYGGVHRDENYLNYKAYSSTDVLRIGRSSLWIKINNGLVIGDMEVASDDFDEVMNKVKEVTRRLGVKRILFHSGKHTRLHSLFAERYKIVSSFPVIFQDFESGIPLDKIKFTFADIDIF